MSRDLNDEKQPVVSSRGIAPRQREQSVPGPGDGNKAAYSGGKGKELVNVSVAGIWGDTGGEGGVGKVARGHRTEDHSGQVAGLNSTLRIVGGPWRGWYTGVMGCDVTSRKVIQLLCRWSGWEQAVEIERMVRSFCPVWMR